MSTNSNKGTLGEIENEGYNKQMIIIFINHPKFTARSASRLTNKQHGAKKGAEKR